MTIQDGWRDRAAKSIREAREQINAKFGDAVLDAKNKAEILSDGLILYPDGEATTARTVIPLVLTVHATRAYFGFVPCDSRAEAKSVGHAQATVLVVNGYGASLLKTYADNCYSVGLPIYCRAMLLKTTQRISKGITYQNPYLSRVPGWADFSEDEDLMLHLADMAGYFEAVAERMPNSTDRSSAVRKPKF